MLAYYWSDLEPRPIPEWTFTTTDTGHDTSTTRLSFLVDNPGEPVPDAPADEDAKDVDTDPVPPPDDADGEVPAGTPTTDTED